jgi:hypothetical protein
MERNEQTGRPEKPAQQPEEQQPRNPFREEAPRDTREISEQEVADSEQQHKEALTERD